MAKSTGPISADPSLAQSNKTAAYFKKLMTGMSMHEGMDSVREADYKGHHIVIETTYAVTIDGTPFEGTLGVTNEGDVHYHGMPNIGFGSAIDLVKAVIDTFPDEFGKGAKPAPHDHDHGGHGDMPMPMPMGARKTPARGVRAVKKPAARATAGRRR